MTFYERLGAAVELLRRRGRVSYRALKREFDLDDAFLEDLRSELVDVQRVARDEDGAVLVWIGDEPREAPPADLRIEPALPPPPGEAERAVRAGLGIVAAVRALPPCLPRRWPPCATSPSRSASACTRASR